MDENTQSPQERSQPTTTVSVLDADLSDLPNALVEALKKASANPNDDDAWDAAEDEVAKAQKPEILGALYAEVLAKVEAAERVEELGQRAVRFHDEWFEDAIVLVPVLDTVLGRVADASWAFERLSLILTSKEKWPELLDRYDMAIRATAEKTRRTSLLDEAAQIAKDFAGQPDRAVRYLEQLFELRPSDAHLAATLERLLEREERHDGLIRVWTLRLPFLPREQVIATRERIAVCWLDRLGDATKAMQAVEALLGESPTNDSTACSLLERIVATESTTDETREQAVLLLEGRYGESRSQQLVDVLRMGLKFTHGARQFDLREKLASRLTSLGDEGAAIEHLGVMLSLHPADLRVRNWLREASERTHKLGDLAQALENAANVAEDHSLVVSLLSEAGALCVDALGQPERAISLLTRAVQFKDVATDLELPASRRLVELLRAAADKPKLLDALERRVQLEPDASERRVVNVEAAQLANELGDIDRELAAWARCLVEDANDIQALDSTITALERGERWDDLLVKLLRRATLRRAEKGDVRADLVEIALVRSNKLNDIDGALAAWAHVADWCGEDEQVVDAIAELLSRAERWGALTTHFDGAAKRSSDKGRQAVLLARCGDVFRERLNDQNAAVDRYVESLDADPSTVGARGGIETLLAADVRNALGVEALVLAYTSTQDWQQLLGLLEHRLAVAADTAAQTQALCEAAELYERQSGDQSSALVQLRRALPLAPERTDIEQELLRLASATGQWALAVDALKDAVAVLPEDSLRRAVLLGREGEILDVQLNDLEGALSAYGASFKIEPSSQDRAHRWVDVAARARRWATAAEAIVASASQRAVVDEALLSIIEREASASDQWADAIDSLEKALAGAKLASDVGCTLERTAGLWYRDHRQDLNAAESALLRAVAHSPKHLETLRILASLQRRAPGASLVKTLLTISSVDADDLAALKEAIDVLCGDAASHAQAKELLVDLRERATKDISSGLSAELEGFASWAVDRSVTLLLQEGDSASATKLLQEQSALPYGRNAARAMKRRAAGISADQLGDGKAAISLLKALLDEEPGDLSTITSLARLYSAEGKYDELLSLRRHELKLTTDIARRLELRLEMASLLANVDVSAQLAELLANLEESHGHEASVDAASIALRGANKLGELADLLERQASLVEQAGQGDRAAILWRSAAQVVEADLKDIPRAIENHRRSVAQQPHPDSLDALARLYTARGEHKLAVACLEQRIEMCEGDERRIVALRLAESFSAAGRMAAAKALLESEIQVAPSAQDLREKLAVLYRNGSEYDGLVSLLAEGADHAQNHEDKLRFWREAAEVSHHGLKDPARAVEFLHKASALRPDDRVTRTHLADALRDSGQLAEARSLLTQMIEEFGRRRTPERAALHYQMALVAREEGKAPEALEQLDLATSMDMGHLGALRLLGEMSRDAGLLDRAERAFRSLLLVVRRNKSQDQYNKGVVLGPSEVLLELHRVAQLLGQNERAAEILESAFESATDPAEARRFEAALRIRGDASLLLRALNIRLANTPTDEAPEVLDELATLLEDAIGDEEAALDARLKAIAIRSPEPEQRARTRTLAARLGASAKFGEAVRQNGMLLRDRGNLDAACEQLLFAASVFENDVNDPAKAIQVLDVASDTSTHVLEVSRAQARLAKVVGDKNIEISGLRKVAELSEDGDERTVTMYQLAALELESPETAASGVDSLRAALDLEPRMQQAADLLRAAASRSGAPASLYLLFERVARDMGDNSILLEALRYVAQLDDTAVDIVKEACDLAASLGQENESLLRRAVEISRLPGHVRSEATWALTQLATAAQSRGDVAGGLSWLREAFAAADDAEAFPLGMQVATLAAGEGNNLDLAYETYSQLMERDPSERSVWVPLLDVTRRLGDDARLEALLGAVTERAEDTHERNQFRLERAKLLLKNTDRRSDALQLLRECIDDDSADEISAELLAAELEKDGATDDLISLLERRLDAARDRGDAAVVVSLSSRLGALLVASRIEDARHVYRSALDWAPDNLGILNSLFALYGPDDDAGERAEVIEKIIPLEAQPRAVALALELAEIRRGLGDEAGTTRALELGYQANPQDTALRERLETWFTERQEWDRLSGVIAADASSRADNSAKCARYREAAALQRDRLNNASKAADLLAHAQKAKPDDLALLEELVQVLCAADRAGEAADQVTANLEARGPKDKGRVELLRLRATARQRAGQEAEAIDDLDEAYTLGGAAYAQPLADALSTRLGSARDRGDRDAEQATTHRLAALLVKMKRADEARELLAQWITRYPSDSSAIHQVLDLDAAAERWEDVISGFKRLLPLTEGAERASVTLQLADACDRVGRPGDAKSALEAAFNATPDDASLRSRLQKLYEAMGAYRELADLHVIQVQYSATEQERLGHLMDAGKLLLYQVNDPTAAAQPIFQALTRQPGNHELTVLLVDAYLMSGQLQAATQLLTTAVESHRGRRSRELATLQHRMARAAYANGDRSIELEWLAVAFETDGQNPEVASELASLAMQFEQWDLALKPLRALTLMKNPHPVTKAMAYLWQGMIAYRQGDAKRAGFLAKKGLQEDPSLQDAKDFLQQIGQS